jgi:hypothetical protein
VCVNSRDLAVVAVVVECASGEQQRRSESVKSSNLISRQKSKPKVVATTKEKEKIPVLPPLRHTRPRHARARAANLLS